MRFECEMGCIEDIGMSKSKQLHRCQKHGAVLRYAKPLTTDKPLRRVSEKREGEVARRGSTLKQGRGLSASPAQQRKVKGLPCIVCGRDAAEEVQIVAAHVYARRFQSCDCGDGVVPLCSECHGRYDDPNQHLDLLPYLRTRANCWTT